MTAEEHRLIALAAAFLPEHAETLLRRRLAADAAAVAQAAGELGRAPRPQRLTALAQALVIQDDGRLTATRAERLVRAERPRVSSVLRSMFPARVASGPLSSTVTAGLAPLLARLCTEHLTRTF